MEEADGPTSIDVVVNMSGMSEINITIMVSTEDGSATSEFRYLDTKSAKMARNVSYQLSLHAVISTDASSHVLQPVVCHQV